ncbi:MAG: 5-formyltetrahydrofolate cyclo-ligase [Candidatus Competibacterales bacterium]|nr:5-formyltetrahydrofolate cyclo-ligase [Candidatus Competibacterales bacterium]
MSTLTVLRRQLRARRSALDPLERERRDALLSATLLELPVFHRAVHVAGYLAFGGEYDPAPVLGAAAGQGKTLYLPVLLGRDQPMLFAPHTPGESLRPNWFGIPEPPVPRERMVEPAALDLVIAPLVGFDDAGFRLGMAGGFYDRSFAFRQTRTGAPWLVGAGYALQRIEPQTPRPWDVRLDAVVTEQGLLDFGLPPTDDS